MIKINLSNIAPKRREMAIGGLDLLVAEVGVDSASRICDALRNSSGAIHVDVRAVCLYREKECAILPAAMTHPAPKPVYNAVIYSNLIAGPGMPRSGAEEQHIIAWLCGYRWVRADTLKDPPTRWWNGEWA